jgi:hypothetical protein
MVLQALRMRPKSNKRQQHYGQNRFYAALHQK